jgi:penicillin V acylase-like amidase (Ntn superfamily)
MVKKTILIAITFLIHPSFGCSAFLLKSNNQNIVGKNYDWTIENGRVLINKRNMEKIAYGVNNPISWKAKFGSVTFNQYGQEFPNGGMNEKGLVIEALWLNESLLPFVDKKSL